MNSTTTDKPKTKRTRKFAREPQGDPARANDPATEAANIATVSAPPNPKTKASLLLLLLARPEGATLAQMVGATDWLPHTTRAALTGLKKKGHMLTSTKADGVRTYRVVTADGVPKILPAETEAEVLA